MPAPYTGTSTPQPTVYPSRRLPKDKSPEEELDFDTNFVAVAAAGTPVQITKLYGGQTLTVWADDGNAGRVYIGNRQVNSTIGFPIPVDGTVSINLTHGFPPHKYLDLYVDAANAADTVHWIKI